MDLHQSLDRFKADLQAYIQAEVSRQLAAQMRNIASGTGRAAQPTASVAQSSEATIQESLDALAALAQTTPRTTSESAVDHLLTQYGGPTATLEASSTHASASNDDYLAELADMVQARSRSAQDASSDELLSMSSSVASTAQPPQPTQVAPTEGSQMDSMSGIQSFLNKIRQRKNLGTN